MIKIIKENGVLLIIIFLATFLRFYHLDFQSIWLDEIHTMIESDPKLTFKEFNDIMMQREGLGHLYFLILKALYFVFGYSTFVARAFSAVVGILSVLAIYFFGKQIQNKKVGLIAALLLSINFFHISYSQEARPYVLLVLFTILSFYWLVLFINKQNFKSALIYGLFTGLIVHAHFVGLITVLSQTLLILFILLKTEREKKLHFLKYSIVAATTALIVVIPTYGMFVKMSKYKSGWLTLPDKDGFTQIFKLFLGDSELLYFSFIVLIIFYFLSLFKEKLNEFSLDKLKEKKLIFGSLILFCWFFLSIIIPIVKSYLSEPMILHRYFIGILPVLLLVIAISIGLIKNKLARIFVLSIIFFFSIVDVFVVKDYYNKVTKTEFREITNIIKKNNTENDNVVSSFGWLMSYFFKDEKNKIVSESTLDNYILSMKNNAIPIESFWYLDGNSRPFSVSNDVQVFIDENFIVKRNIVMFDTWTTHYVSKNKPSNKDKLTVYLKDFTPSNLDGIMNLYIFENSTISSPILEFEKGNYQIILQANSLPEVPIKGENAHIIIKLDDEEIGNYYLSEKTSEKELIIPFECFKTKKASIKIIFDNDLSYNGLDRNVIINSIKIEKK